MSPNTQIGKTRAHRIAAANTAHAVSGVLINMGMLMMVCTVLAMLCTAMILCGVCCTVASPYIIAAVAVAGVAAILCSVITGCSIRDLVESCRQVKQVKEEGLATVQSLQPVLTHVTPIAERTGNGRIAKLLTGKAKAEDAAQAAVDQGTAVGGTNKVIAGVATSSGIVKVMAEADPSTLKDAIKAVGGTGYGLEGMGAGAVAGGVTGTAVVTGVGIAAGIWYLKSCVAGCAAKCAAACACAATCCTNSGASCCAAVVLGCVCTAAAACCTVAFIPYALMAFSILISICTVIQTVADLYSARVPVVSMQDPVHKRDTTEYDVIENYKPQKISRIKWLAPPEAASPTHRILMAVAGVAVVACISILLCCCLPTIAVVVPPLVSCVFYGLSSCVGGIDAYVYKRKAAKAALPVETSPIVLGQRASECPEQLQNEVAVETANMTSDSVQQTQDWEPVAKDAGQEWEPTQRGAYPVVDRKYYPREKKTDS
ncbi:hypothetical protein AM773 [Anaplasma marginale str. St. Maries]|uniref:hypothetical protein n=1 Tax=Anaplasma marginale TaxID=770 RepID=UPI0000497C3E|nr:hypothetical protein [Anaplasma marginale]AAV86711.1 hypothetical protein AM773 [Anaplasma marginale str. St. Maries]